MRSKTDVPLGISAIPTWRFVINLALTAAAGTAAMYGHGHNWWQSLLGGLATASCNLLGLAQPNDR